MKGLYDNRMHIELVDSPDKSLLEFIAARLREFNGARRTINEMRPIAIKIQGENGEIVAGTGAKTFGLWLMIDHLWVSETLRGKKMGSQILTSLETAARARGCKYVLLDTLNFQARPFYEKHGYRLQWTQEHYPIEGCKYFMTKEL